MKRIYASILCIFIFNALAAQISNNMTLLGQWDDDDLPLRSGLAYNEIWGYADLNTGNEYAIIGTVKKVFILDITNPSSPTVEAEFTGGSNTIWRDMKTYGSYLYCVADEGSEGMMIIDLSDFTSGPTLVAQLKNDFLRAHNIFIDESNGRLYVVGSNAQSQGMIVYDLTVDPENPTLLANMSMPGGYIHDMYARGNTVYCNHGNSGLYVYDLSTVTSPVQLGALTSYAESGYNHSSWLNDAGDYLVFCDETHGRGVKMLDVSSFSPMTVVDLFRSELMAPTYTNSIAHNPLIKGDSVYISYYHDGIQVFDISTPNDVKRVAYYDTYTAHPDYGGYDGAWGVYPFLPSGNIIGSDILNGLHVLAFSSNALPVEWLDFYGVAQGNSTILHWATASETNSEVFIIERSTDGRQFEAIGQTQAAGNSLFEQAYQFIDPKPSNGWNYYRLRQVDYDQQFSFSKTIALQFGDTDFRIYPNQIQAGQGIQIQLPQMDAQGAMLQLYNAAGQLVHQEEVDASFPQLEWYTPSLSAGAYVLKLTLPSNNHYQERIFIR